MTFSPCIFNCKFGVYHPSLLDIGLGKWYASHHPERFLAALETTKLSVVLWFRVSHCKTPGGGRGNLPAWYAKSRDVFAFDGGDYFVGCASS
ncbi:MAG TPA: hypothetical protein G4N95_04845 [Anaerolineae bacterium]|nr:hypothetical protein [Anaerolineae bacterium]